MSNISDLLFENKECSRIFLSASDIGEKLETPEKRKIRFKMSKKLFKKINNNE